MEHLFLAEMQKHCLKCRLEKFEIPQALKLVPDVWTPDMVHVYFVPVQGSFFLLVFLLRIKKLSLKVYFNIFQGLVTAAFKLKRKNIQDRYQMLIDRMYSQTRSNLCRHIPSQILSRVASHVVKQLFYSSSYL